MPELTMGSLFDGIGVFPLAASRHGIVPVWASEIVPDAISITKRHFPEMVHLGDITELSGSKIPAVDVITFGSPCQNFSQIGDKSGIQGVKSSLFYQAIRIIDEMRNASGNRFPAIAVWENVIGARLSGNRLDYLAVLRAFTGAEIPMPASGQWADAGMVRGRRCDLAWRILDAQYWANPRIARRQRIFLVADFTGQRAGEILFKSESVLGYTPKSKEQRAEAAGQSTNSLRTESSRGGEVLGLDFAHADSVVRTYKDITPTLVQNMGRGGGQTPCIMYEQRTIAIDQGGGKSQCGITTELSPTLTCTHGGEPVIYSEKRNVIPLRDEVTRNKASNGLGVGKVGGPCPTLTTADIHSVFYEAYQHHGYRESDTSGTLTAGQNNTVRGDTPLIVTDKKAFEENQHGGYRETQINGTLKAAGGLTAEGRKL